MVPAARLGLGSDLSERNREDAAGVIAAALVVVAWWVRFELLASVRYGELRGRDGQVTVAQCFDLCGCAECEENVQ